MRTWSIPSSLSCAVLWPGGNADFAKLSSTVIAHENVRKRLAAGSGNVAGQKVPPAAPAALPAITFNDSLTVHVNGEDVRALHFASVGDPGHGELAAKADVQKFTAMLRECVDLVQAGLRAGKSLEQIKSEHVLAKYDALGQGFIKTDAFTEQIYAELRGSAADSEPRAGLWRGVSRGREPGLGPSAPNYPSRRAADPWKIPAIQAKEATAMRNRWVGARSALAAAGAVLAGGAGAVAQNFDPAAVQIKVEKVAGSVYMLTGQGGNIGVSVGDDGILIVDDQFASLAPKIQAALKGIADKPVRFVLNTHYHGDHTGGNAEFAKLSSTIIAHENVRKRLAADPQNAANPQGPSPLPAITFSDSLTVHINGEDIRALHFASGHTDGDSILFFPKANVVHFGDSFVTYGFPFIDVNGGGSLRGLIQNVNKAADSLPEDVKVIPGHGPLSSKADVRKFTAMLSECVDLVQAAIQAGKSLEQMKSEKVLQKYDSLGQGFIKTDAFTELIHAELQGSAQQAG